MAVHSEGIMLERSIVIGRDESYHFPQHYHRTRPCGDKFNFQGKFSVLLVFSLNAHSDPCCGIEKYAIYIYDMYNFSACGSLSNAVVACNIKATFLCSAVRIDIF